MEELERLVVPPHLRRGELSRLEPVEAAARRSHEEVEQAIAPVGGVHEHEAAGAGPGEGRLRGERHERRRHGRVDGVATLAQDARPGLRRERVTASHHTSHGGDFSARTGVG